MASCVPSKPGAAASAIRMESTIENTAEIAGGGGSRTHRACCDIDTETNSYCAGGFVVVCGSLKAVIGSI